MAGSGTNRVGTGALARPAEPSSARCSVSVGPPFENPRKVGHPTFCRTLSALLRVSSSVRSVAQLLLLPLQSPQEEVVACRQTSRRQTEAQDEHPSPSSAWAGVFLCGTPGRRQKDPHLLPVSCCPMGFDFDGSRFAVHIVAETAPCPILGPRHQPARHGDCGEFSAISRRICARSIP
jgi:hypothetical protein